MLDQEPYKALSRRAFYWAWIKYAFSGKLAWVERLEFLLVLVGAPVSRWDRIEEPISVLVWALPVSLFLATILVGLIVAPYTIYEPVTQQLVEVLSGPSFPNVEIEKHSMEMRGVTHPRSGQPGRLYILRTMRITNRGSEKVSLGFRLNVRKGDTLHLGIRSVLGQLNVGPGLVELSPLPWLQSPLDLEPKSSEQGNMAFALSDFSYEETGRDTEQEAQEEPEEVELEVSDYLSGTSIRMSPASGYPPLAGIAHRELTNASVRRTVRHESL